MSLFERKNAKFIFDEYYRGLMGKAIKGGFPEEADFEIIACALKFAHQAILETGKDIRIFNSLPVSEIIKKDERAKLQNRFRLYEAVARGDIQPRGEWRTDMLTDTGYEYNPLVIKWSTVLGDIIACQNLAEDYDNADFDSTFIKDNPFFEEVMLDILSSFETYYRKMKQVKK